MGKVLFRNSARQLIAGLFIAAAFCGTARAGDIPLMNAGAKIRIDFADMQESNLVFVCGLPPVPGVTNLTGLTVGINVGGIQRMYTLSPEGEGVMTPDLFQLRSTGNGFALTLSTFDNALAPTYQPFGLINQSSNNTQVSIPVSVMFNNQTFSTMLNGGYYAIANTDGRAYLGIVRPPPKDPFKTLTHITKLSATPNPAQAGQTVTIKGDISLKNFTGPVAADLHFGDRTAPVHMDGASFQKLLKAGITHTYMTEGVFVARVTLVAGEEIADTRLFVVVGSGFVVNSKTGAVGRLIKNGLGSVTLQVALDNVPGAMNAQTKFKDMKGNIAGAPPGGPPPPAGQKGLAPANVFTNPGVFVAEAMALDAQGNPLSVLRHTIPIGMNEVNTSINARADGGSAAPRDTGDATLTLSSMSGKFQFTSSKADKVIFNGKFSLPAGYTPKNTDGNDIIIGMGNVIDTVHVNSKGKAVFPTTSARITKFRMTLPKLTDGVAIGGEIAKVSLTMNTADLDLQGFDSEGISVDVRSDESGQSIVARFIQVDMVVGGQSYSVLVQVSYSTGNSGDFGTMSARSSN